MSKSTPVVVQVSRTGLLVQIVLIAGLAFVGMTFAPPTSRKLVTYSLLCGYFVLSHLLRRIVARSHRRGHQLVRRGDFASAAAEFEESYRFFSRNSWIDRWQAVTLLSVSGLTYREMALCSIAFCKAQIGDGVQCRYWYERALKEFPNSSLAQSALRLLDAASGAQAATSGNKVRNGQESAPPKD